MAAESQQQFDDCFVVIAALHSVLVASITVYLFFLAHKSPIKAARILSLAF